MAHYAIGDVQGCYKQLKELLTLIDFNSQLDRLFFVGDLVNRGPDSLKVLRFIKSLSSVTIVLGNHDLHLLAVHSGAVKTKNSDTIDNVLLADDCDELCHWLQQQPLLFYEPILNFVLVHAGIYPLWTLEQSLLYSKEVQEVLRSDNAARFFEHLYGNNPVSWDDSLEGWDRLRFITNALTRMRYCRNKGELDFIESGPPGSQAQGLVPWFNYPGRIHVDSDIIFGHWASLMGKLDVSGVYGIDTGCVWGNQLTAFRMEDRKKFSV